jgi:hypothetical protein
MGLGQGWLLTAAIFGITGAFVPVVVRRHPAAPAAAVPGVGVAT